MVVGRDGGKGGGGGGKPWRIRSSVTVVPQSPISLTVD